MQMPYKIYLGVDFMKFSDNEKEKIRSYLVNRFDITYNKNMTNNNVDSNMKNILKYYDNVNKTDFQTDILSKLKESSFQNFLNEVEHDRDDDKQKDEGKDISNEKIKEIAEEQIDKNKMSSDVLNKDKILEEVGELVENEEDIAKSDIKKVIEAAAINAIYEAVLEKYDQNLKEINKHYEMTGNADESRLINENILYEQYLMKLNQRYISVFPGKKDIENSNLEIADYRKSIFTREEKLKNSQLNKERRDVEQIDKVNEERKNIIHEMAILANAANNTNNFEAVQFQMDELQKELNKKEMEMAYLKPSPGELYERQENRNYARMVATQKLGTYSTVAVDTYDINNNKATRVDEKDINNQKKLDNTTMQINETVYQNAEEILQKAEKALNSNNPDFAYINEMIESAEVMINGQSTYNQDIKENTTGDHKRDYYAKDNYTHTSEEDKPGYIKNESQKIKENLGCGNNNVNKDEEILAKKSIARERIKSCRKALIENGNIEKTNERIPTRNNKRPY